MAVTIRRSRTRHVLLEDASLADPYERTRRARLGLPQRQWCGLCGLPGQPGDVRHLPTSVTQQWRERDAQVLGEREREPERVTR